MGEYKDREKGKMCLVGISEKGEEEADSKKKKVNSVVDIFHSV